MRHSLLLVLIAAAGALVGCSSPPAQFEQNVLYLRKQEMQTNAEFSDAQRQNLADVMAALYGTPDEPVVPDLGPAGVLDASAVEMSAGPVARNELAEARGLYRQHCVHCHGITGNGRGPTAAFLNPYPRDFTMGKFKFKSTKFGVKPRQEDLHRVIMEGIPGTAMPAFKLLSDEEVESLVQYVKYLSIRGETERNLIALLTELDEGELLLDPQAKEDDPDVYEFGLEDVTFTAERVLKSWDLSNSQLASANVPSMPTWQTPEEQQQAYQRGREVFYSATANCFSCHGETAMGDGQTNIWDEWTAELNPDEPETLQQYIELGALPPRHVLPRNLRQGVFRGGHRPIDLYWRIRHGIEGSTMPAAPLAENSPSGLSQEDLWALVYYVQMLPHDEFSGGRQLAALQRERQ